MQQNDDAARMRVKQERDTSPRQAAVPGDKENSEPMETASTIAEMLAAPPTASTAIPPRISTTQSGMNASSSTSSTDSPARFASPQKNSSRSSLQAKAAVIAAIGTPDMRSVTGTPQSLTQLFANLPSSAFTFDLPDFQSPTGSGLLSPIGSARLGKKRPLSISPLSCSSVNIDALVRGSPTSLMGYLAGSRSSSAGSFGHLSPSLYITPANVQGYSRPMISLAKAVHPAANSLPGSNPLLMEQRARQAASNQIKQEDVQSQCSRKTNSQSESMSQDGDTAIEIEVAANVVVSSTNNYSETDSNKRVYIPAGKANHKPNRIYYSYPSTEQPHNNKCRWRDCTRQCDSLDELVRHVNTDHVYQDSKREYVCHWEGCVRDKRSFKAQYMLLVHMRRHTGEKPHKCHFEGCDKAYSRLENLKTHVRSHTGERPYVCKYESCGKAFSNASDCAKHMNRTHSDEKPYACLNPGCTKRYTDPSSRRKHMKNCQVNKRVHTMEADTTSGADESASDGQTGSFSSSSKKVAQKPRKIDRKKREEIHHYPTHSSNDLGYSSGGSHTASFVSHMTGNAHHSEYSSSGYDTEYSDQPNTLNFQTDQLDCSPMVWSPPVSIKEEFYPPMTYHQSSNQISPMGHVTNGHVLQTNIYQVPPRPRISRHAASKPSNLSTLPEMAMPPLVNGYIVAGTPSQHVSGFTDPFVGLRSSLPSDDTASLNSSLNSSGRHNSLKSEYSNSRSSFSPYSSRVSSAAGSNHSHDHSLSSHRTIQPPDHILRHHHQSANSIQPFDLKQPPRYYRRQSDEMSMRSSHSSRYSGSEYSDDYATHLPVQPNAFSPHHPLPLPQSMQPDFAMSSTGYFEQTSPPQVNSIHSSGAPSIASEQSDDAVGGSLPLHHYELGPTPFSKPSLTIPDVILYDRATSPNMVIGNMSTFTEQLHQESMLLGGLAATGSALS